MTKMGDSVEPNDLGEMEGDETFVFPPAERRVITQPVDLSVQTLVEQWESKQLLLPEIQREYVWDNGKASRLIESLLLNIPIPVLYFAETQDATYHVIDGHQRVRSIVRFLRNEFPLSGLAVLSEYQGHRLHKLPEREQRFLRMRTLRAILISIDSHPNMKFEIFERLNTGAISLNAQELRNSLYRGNFNTLLHRLARDSAFRALIGTRVPRKRMVDEELILRFLALSEGLDTYRPPLKRFLNSFASSKKDLSDKSLVPLERDFARAVASVTKLFGEGAFRVSDKNGHPREKTVNRALFDAHMMAASWINENVSEAQVKKLRRKVGALYDNEVFLDAIQRATGDRARTLKRLRDTVAAFRAAEIVVEVPFDLSK